LFAGAVGFPPLCAGGVGLDFGVGLGFDPRGATFGVGLVALCFGVGFFVGLAATRSAAGFDLCAVLCFALSWVGLLAAFFGLRHRQQDP
jgi:hypothetical protein